MYTAVSSLVKSDRNNPSADLGLPLTFLFSRADKTCRNNHCLKKKIYLFLKSCFKLNYHKHRYIEKKKVN